MFSVQGKVLFPRIGANARMRRGNNRKPLHQSVRDRKRMGTMPTYVSEAICLLACTFLHRSDMLHYQ